MPLGPRRAGRGDAAPRPRRRPHRDDPELRRLRGRRRVQRRPRAQALLRPAHGDRDLARRQPRRPADRGPDLPGRGRAGAPPLAPVRRRRPRGPQRAQLHRARLRRPAPRSAAPTAATRQPRSSGRATSTGSAIFGAEGARWFHCGGVFGALSRAHGGAGARGDAGRAPARDDRLVRPQLPPLAVGVLGRHRARRRGQRPPRRERRRPARERGRSLGRARLLGRRRRRRPPPPRFPGLRGVAASA